MLVLRLIGPAFPIVWALIGAGSFILFGLKNLQITGMIIMMIGVAMNIAPVVANGSMPVSELALQSVGQVDDEGNADISGLRESSSTAGRLAAFGDVVPVPVVNSVVSLGDLVMLIALADITSNLWLRTRRRELDDAGVTFANATDDATSVKPKRVEVVSPLNLGNRPAHAAHRRPRRKAAPSTHVPAHAMQPLDADTNAPAASPAGPGSSDYSPAHASADSAQLEPAGMDLTDQATSVPADLPAPELAPESYPTIIDLTDPADRRPIIDLTISPTDAQLCEFLRRRERADAKIDERPAPGPRRGRAPRRSAEVVEVQQ